MDSRRGLDVDTVLAFMSKFPDNSFRLFSPTRRPLGDGDLDDAFHDLRAKVANDSDTALVLSRVDLEIEGTGGTSLAIPRDGSEVSRPSDEPFVELLRCIQDLGRATRDFLLPTLSCFPSSSFEGDVLTCVRPSTWALFSDLVVGELSAEATWYCSLVY